MPWSCAEASRRKVREDRDQARSCRANAVMTAKPSTSAGGTGACTKKWWCSAGCSIQSLIPWTPPPPASPRGVGGRGAGRARGGGRQAQAGQDAGGARRSGMRTSRERRVGAPLLSGRSRGTAGACCDQGVRGARVWEGRKTVAPSARWARANKTSGYGGAGCGDGQTRNPAGSPG